VWGRWRRTLVFTVTYDRGSDPIADVLIDYPDVVMTLLYCTVREDRVWILILPAITN
jgi:hypothetical protein